MELTFSRVQGSFDERTFEVFADGERIGGCYFEDGMSEWAADADLQESFDGREDIATGNSHARGMQADLKREWAEIVAQREAKPAQQLPVKQQPAPAQVQVQTLEQQPAPLIRAETAALIDASISDNTKRTYTHALSKLQAFLDGRPLADALLAEYLTFLFAEGWPDRRTGEPRPQAPAAIAVVLTAIRFVEKVNGAAQTAVGPLTARTMAGIRRTGIDRGRGQVRSLTPEDARVIARLCRAEGTIAAARDAALVATMSDGLLRLSELCSLNLHDLHANGTILIRKSKTDQEGRGAFVALGRSTRALLKAYIDRAGIKGDRCPLFCPVRRGDHPQVGERMTTHGVRVALKKRASDAGLDGVSGHSPRIGMAQALAEKGATLVEMQQAGRWDSPNMPAHYSRQTQARKSAVLRLIHKESD